MLVFGTRKPLDRLLLYRLPSWILVAEAAIRLARRLWRRSGCSIRLCCAARRLTSSAGTPTGRVVSRHHDRPNVLRTYHRIALCSPVYYPADRVACSCALGPTQDLLNTDLYCCNIAGPFIYSPILLCPADARVRLNATISPRHPFRFRLCVNDPLELLSYLVARTLPSITLVMDDTCVSSVQSLIAYRSTSLHPGLTLYSHR